MIRSIFAYTDGGRIIALSDGEKTVPMVYTELDDALKMEPMVADWVKKTNQKVWLVNWNSYSVIRSLAP